MLAERETRHNGMAKAVPFKTIVIDLAEFGYAGWTVTMRTDPRSSVYDDLTSGEMARWWAAFGKVVLDWTLTDDQGHVLPHPKDADSVDALDLRVGVLGFILNRYFEAVRAAAELPKESSASSAPTSSTSAGSPPNA